MYVTAAIFSWYETGPWKGAGQPLRVVNALLKEILVPLVLSGTVQSHLQSQTDDEQQGQPF